jgi:hypothetical protein
MEKKLETEPSDDNNDEDSKICSIYEDAMEDPVQINIANC